ncbi:MAG: hypothetical protein IJC26_06460 [Clostridia bacterium]|nr:hypothetical protein [Clostridia bacterium]
MKFYRTLLAALLLISMLLPLASCGSEPLPEATAETEETAVTEEVVTTAEPVEDNSSLTEYKMGDITNSVKLLGERSGFNKDGELIAEWSGSGFEMRVKIAEGGSDLRLGFRCNYAARWKVYVDGEQFGERFATSTGNRKQTVANGIPAGEHTIAIVKDTQPATSRNNYNSVLSVAFNGEFLEAPAKNDLYLEFIGDGYMVGFGALGKGSSSSASQIIEETSVTAALPYLTSRAMGADYSIVAHSQIGFYTKAGAYKMPALYDNRYAYRELDTRYKPERKPDAIVIHVGMDDTLESLPMGQYIVAAKNFTEDVRDYYKDQSIPVVWVYNTLYHTVRAGEIEALIQYMGGEAANVYALKLAYGANGSGSTETDRYPSAEDHQKSADILVPFLKQLLGR